MFKNYFKVLIPLLLIHSGCKTTSKNGFVSIFDGKTLSGWHAMPEDCMDDWSVSNGIIVGEGSEDRLAYLVYDDYNLKNFELKLSYRLPGDGNTGVEIRSRIDTTGKRPFEGYHADLGHVGIGPQVLGAWDFHFAEREEYPCERGTRLVIDHDGETHFSDIPDALEPENVNKHKWNTIHVVVLDNNFRFFINGKLSSEFTDNFSDALTHGAIALQIHDKGMRVEFKDIKLKLL
jgi:hypothetical protein